MKKVYTEEMRKYILDNSQGKTVQTFTEEFNNKFNLNITKSAMKSYYSTHKIKIGRHNFKKYNEIQIKFIKENVKGITLKELTNRFNKEFNMNVSESVISNIKNKYHLKSGIVGGQFIKGQTSYNKGKKMSKEQYEKSKNTMFKKGNIPANRKEINSVRIDKNDYEIIKIQDGHKNKNWIPKHRYIYEKEYGKIPKNHKVIFADGNKRNFNIDNLILVSNAEQLIMNRRHLIKNDAELTKTGVLIAKVINTANKRKKGK